MTVKCDAQTYRGANGLPCENDAGWVVDSSACAHTDRINAAQVRRLSCDLHISGFVHQGHDCKPTAVYPHDGCFPEGDGNE